MKEPTTEAGQQLLADFRDEDGEWLAPWRVRGMILAIEAEARRLTVERLTDALTIVTDALDAAGEDAHAGWAYYEGDEPSSHADPDNYDDCTNSMCRRRQGYVADARAALAQEETRA